MKTYEERAIYILKRRDEIIEKRRENRARAVRISLSVFAAAAVITVGTLGIGYLVPKNSGFVYSDNVSGFGTQASAGASSGDVPAVSALPAKRIEPIGYFPLPRERDFSLEEFPNVTFHYSRDKVTAAENGETRVLFSAFSVDEVFVDDLDGDGLREIFANVIKYTGAANEHEKEIRDVLAYDYSDMRCYDFASENWDCCFPGLSHNAEPSSLFYYNLSDGQSDGKCEELKLSDKFLSGVDYGRRFYDISDMFKALYLEKTGEKYTGDMSVSDILCYDFFTENGEKLYVLTITPRNDRIYQYKGVWYGEYYVESPYTYTPSGLGAYILNVDKNKLYTLEECIDAYGIEKVFPFLPKSLRPDIKLPADSAR